MGNKQSTPNNNHNSNIISNVNTNSTNTTNITNIKKENENITPKIENEEQSNNIKEKYKGYSEFLENSSTDNSAQLFLSFPSLVISNISNHLTQLDLRSFIFTSKKIKEKLYAYPPRSFRHQRVFKNILVFSQKLKDRKLNHKPESLELCFYERESTAEVFQNLSPYMGFVKEFSITLSNNRLPPLIYNWKEFFPQDTIESLTLREFRNDFPFESFFIPKLKYLDIGHNTFLNKDILIKLFKESESGIQKLLFYGVNGLKNDIWEEILQNKGGNIKTFYTPFHNVKIHASPNESNQKLTENDFLAISKYCENLEELQINENTLSEKSIFEISQNCRKLKHLSLEGCRCTNYSSISSMKNLTFLRLNNCEPKEEDLTLIAKNCTKLQFLHLRYTNCLTTPLLDLFSEIPLLKTLNLNNCQQIGHSTKLLSRKDLKILH